MMLFRKVLPRLRSLSPHLERNAIDFLNSMKEKKVRIMLDDYGSGLSSLSTLESYDFNTLKLDIGFIRKIGQSERAETIIRSTISMAHEFGADVIAEGVETEQQVSFLSDAGCDMIQGFYFGKPKPVESVFKHLEEKGIGIEERKWRHFYEIAASNVRVTDEPLEIVELTGIRPGIYS